MSAHNNNHQWLWGILLGSVLTASSIKVYNLFFNEKQHAQRPRRDSLDESHLRPPGNLRGMEIVDGVDGLIGNTPLMRIRSLSEATGCTILGKAEFLNPGGSAKDRVALNIIKTAEDEGILHPDNGSTVFEGTVGSTGISIAMIARAKGYNAWIVMPDDQAKEKYQLLEKLGATVEKVRPVSIIDKKQFVNLARTRAQEFGKEDSNTTGAIGYFADQFENKANFQIHYKTTGPEIYRQTGGKIDAIVLGAGTGGTLSGISTYLKSFIPRLKVYLVDPPGSGLYHKVKHGILYSPFEAEGTRRRHQVDTVVEGIGINRLTQNFDLGLEHIDNAYRATDEEAVKMARYLVREDGLFIGSSSAVNCVGAVRVARELGPGHVIVTLLNDSGQRHLTKFWSDDYLRENGIAYELSKDDTVDTIVR